MNPQTASGIIQRKYIYIFANPAWGSGTPIGVSAVIPNLQSGTAGHLQGAW